MLEIQNIINGIVDSQHEKLASHATHQYSVDTVVDSLEKVASGGVDSKISDLLKIASDTIKKLSDENNNLEKQAEVRVLVEDMNSKGIIDDGELGKKTADLLDKSREELHIIKEAIKIASNMNSGSNNFEYAENISSNTSKKHMFDSILNIN